MNVLKNIRIVSLLKYNIPLFVSIIGGYYTFKYFKQSFGVNEVFSSIEEKTISKKLTPILKYKLIDKLYAKDSKELLIISELYTTLINILNLKVKPEIYLFESDVCYLNILNNGALFMSDKFFYKIKSQSDFTLLIYVLLHSLNHIRLKNTTKNLVKVFSKVSL